MTRKELEVFWINLGDSWRGGYLHGENANLEPSNLEGANLKNIMYNETTTFDERLEK